MVSTVTMFNKLAKQGKAMCQCKVCDEDTTPLGHDKNQAGKKTQKKGTCVDNNGFGGWK